MVLAGAVAAGEHLGFILLQNGDNPFWSFIVMRHQFLLAVTLVAAVILTTAFFLHPKPKPVVLALANGVVAPPPAPREPVAPPPMTFAPSPEPASSPEERQAAIDQHLQLIQTWAVADDASGIENIINEIATNSESEVRYAAIRAAKQSGHREIIPTLQDVAARVDDLKEKRALLDAAEFLAGPTVSEQAGNPQRLADATP
jgi:hypothetical protein